MPDDMTRFAATPLTHEPERIVKFSRDEGQDRKTSPSMNAPHTELEAMCAVLMSVRRNAEEGWERYRNPPAEHYAFAPPMARAQRIWISESYADIVRLLSARIEEVQFLMDALEKANKKTEE